MKIKSLNLEKYLSIESALLYTNHDSQDADKREGVLPINRGIQDCTAPVPLVSLHI